MDIVIIPAYNPDWKLINLVQELTTRGIQDIIVINDGSNEENLEIFKQLESIATVLTHSVNLGKGAAIKSALSYVSKHYDQRCSVVLMDADGQHRPEDACRLLDALYDKKSGLVLGVRQFHGKIPIRSLFGNVITRYVFRLASGIWVSDTQTGLRAFYTDLIPKLLGVAGERYEYEMNVLLALAKDKTRISEVPIATIYEDQKNSSSHFRVVRDSARIYRNILAFSGASFLSFILDFFLFFPMVWLFSIYFADSVALVYGNIATRVISASFNYYLNRKFVFRYRVNPWKSMMNYALLACVILGLNTILLSWFHEVVHITKALAKLLTELILFFFSYVVQKLIVFREKK
jgi:putative flippase GtrA